MRFILYYKIQKYLKEKYGLQNRQRVFDKGLKYTISLKDEELVNAIAEDLRSTFGAKVTFTGGGYREHNYMRVREVV